MEHRTRVKNVDWQHAMPVAKNARSQFKPNRVKERILFCLFRAFPYKVQKICATYAQHMHNICTTYAKKYEKKIWKKYAQHMHNICTTYAKNVQKYAKNNDPPAICQCNLKVENDWPVGSESLGAHYPAGFCCGNAGRYSSCH